MALYPPPYAYHNARGGGGVDAAPLRNARFFRRLDRTRAGSPAPEAGSVKLEKTMRSPMCRIAAAAALLCVAASAVSASDGAEQKQPIRVACVGDSITYGARLSDRENDSYPAVLQRLLGPDYQVANFGVGGCTLIRKGKPTVWNQLEKVRAFKPDMVVVSLGTNDTCGGERDCWAHQAEFPQDCRDLVDALRAFPSKPRIWLCAPTPMVLETPGLSSSREEDLEQRRPRLFALIAVIRRVSQEKQAGYIDLNTPLADRPELFTETDGVHPNMAGYRTIAELVFAELRKSAANGEKPARDAKGELTPS